MACVYQMLLACMQGAEQTCRAALVRATCSCCALPAWVQMSAVGAPPAASVWKKRETSELPPGLTTTSSCSPACPPCSKKSERGYEEAKSAALKLLTARPHSRKEVGQGLTMAFPGRTVSTQHTTASISTGAAGPSWVLLMSCAQLDAYRLDRSKTEQHARPCRSTRHLVLATSILSIHARTALWRPDRICPRDGPQPPAHLPTYPPTPARLRSSRPSCWSGGTS